MAMTSHRSAFREQLELLLRLHLEMNAGRAESMEADRIRDEMDVYWPRLTSSEIEQVEGLSADLYSIGVDRQAAGGSSSLDFANELVSLTAREAWYEILNRVRAEEPSLLPRDVAYARGLCWAHLGEPRISIEFLNEAARLRPLAPAEEVLLLTCFIQANRAVDAIERANAIRASENNPLLLIKAAEVFSAAADESRKGDAAKYRLAAIDCGERGFALIAGIEITRENKPVLDALVVPAYLHLALNYEELGQHSKAVDVCRKALEIAADDPNALMLYGFLTFNEFPSAQKTQFIGQFHDRLSSVASLGPQLN
jgi:tetratricopeptide (TPR) repeat protein